jgi:hypothetical protein
MKLIQNLGSWALALFALFGLCMLACKWAAAEECEAPPAPDPTVWTTQQIVLESVTQAALFVDYKQTLDIKRHQGFSETNPILGLHPSDTRVRAYFLASSILSLGIAQLLQGSSRTAFMTGEMSFELAVVKRNVGLGLTVRF